MLILFIPINRELSFVKYTATDMIFYIMNNGFAEIIIGTPIDLFFHGLAKMYGRKSYEEATRHFQNQSKI